MQTFNVFGAKTHSGSKLQVSDLNNTFLLQGIGCPGQISKEIEFWSQLFCGAPSIQLDFEETIWKNYDFYVFQLKCSGRWCSIDFDLTMFDLFSVSIVVFQKLNQW